MARKTSKRGKPAKRATAEQTNAPTRRQVVGRLAVWGGLGAAALGGGTVFAMDFRRKLAELDLSVIGQGAPVVVQIHDPQCGLCTELQRQTRKALKSLDDDCLTYRVANIRTEEGASHQAREGLPHVTLALYNEAGDRVHVIEGVTPAEQIAAAFRTYLKRQPA